MKKIAFTAQPFGFGPVSKMLAVSENVERVKKVFLGSGTALDLAKMHHFDEVYEATYQDAERIVSILEDCDLFLNVMDFPLLRYARIANCRSIMVDSLLYFWQKKPEFCEYPDIYFCQNFFGNSTQEKIKLYGLQNARIIGPIINSNFVAKEKKNQAMINFGGMDSCYTNVGRNSFYLFVILEHLIPLLYPLFESILITGRERVMRMCRRRYQQNSKHLQFEMLSQNKMHTEISQSRCLFTLPGIQTFFDAHDKVPIFCLPAHNSSNRKNLDILIRNQVIKHAFRWQYIYDVDVDLEEEQDIQQMLQFSQRFSEDVDAQKLFRHRVDRFLLDRNNWVNIVDNQKQKVEDLGASGVTEITNAINEMLYHQQPVTIYS